MPHFLSVSYSSPFFFVSKKTSNEKLSCGILWTGGSSKFFSCSITGFILLVQVKQKSFSGSVSKRPTPVASWRWYLDWHLKSNLCTVHSFLWLTDFRHWNTIWVLFYDVNKKVCLSEGCEFPLTEIPTCPVRTLHSGWQCFLQPWM